MMATPKTDEEKAAAKAKADEIKAEKAAAKAKAKAENPSIADAAELTRKAAEATQKAVDKGKKTEAEAKAALAKARAEAMAKQITTLVENHDPMEVLEFKCDGTLPNNYNHIKDLINQVASNSGLAAGTIIYPIKLRVIIDKAAKSPPGGKQKIQGLLAAQGTAIGPIEWA